MRYSNVPRAGRRGFTLIELLVVISIIALLMALSAGAYFRVSSTQMQSRTETTVKAVAKGLETHWRAVIDDVKNEIKNGKASVFMGAADNDRDRANALYTILRLKQEFPTSFDEIRTGVAILGTKTEYVQAIQGAASTGNAYDESAACLYLALSQTRRGATFNAGDAGAGSVSSIPFGGTTLPVFIDAYGTAIWLERATNYSLIYNELSAPPYSPSTGPLDPLDPFGKLQKWPNSYAKNAARQACEYWDFKTGAKVPYDFAGVNRGPFVRSAGKDKTPMTDDDILSYRLMIEGRKGN